MSVDLKSLIAKLNEPTRAALEAAAGFCLSRTHYDIEVEHYALKLMDATDCDTARILTAFGVDKSRLAAELTRSVDRLKSGNARTPALSPSLLKMFREAWVVGSINYAAGQIRSGFTVLALASHEDLSRLMREVSKEFQKIQPEVLRKEFNTIVSGSREDAMTAPAAVPGAPGEMRPGVMSGKTPFLDQYTQNLTEKARQGKLDPVLGRDFEIRQVIDILLRRRQNNPILTGEAGVGKTAVVEGLAARVVAGDVPPPLRNVSMRVLDLALLQAGAGVKGEFENRLKGLIDEVKSSPTPVILFIDEAHTMIGAGGSAGQGDAANLLKPALARGELRTIAATTWPEYKKFFEKDAALARRFQVVKVEEPDEEQCMVMMRGLVESLEKHHSLRILDEAVSSAVRLSHRYLAGRQLPDKAVSVLDTACARQALSQSATPGAIESMVRELDDLAVQQRILDREVAVGADHRERLQDIATQRQLLERNLSELRQRWDKVRDLVGKMRDLRTQLETPPAPPAEAAEGAPPPAPAPDPAMLRRQLQTLERELDKIQGDDPLMRVCVDGQVISEVISGWTGIPVGKMVKDEIATVLALDQHLGHRIIGQNKALQAVSQRIVTSRARLDDPGKPVGVFLFIGPSGVGKTETALALSDLLYGGERNLITINMSEFQEAHTVSTLKGSPPGYVGYGEGGVLTEAVRRRPYSVVLLDEVEKAHGDVLELFYQVFDKGTLEDGEGRVIDFKNTIILLTTNACTDTFSKLCADPATTPEPEALVQALRPELNKLFKPAFLGRLLVVPFYPIRDESLRKIIELKLGRVQKRLRENHRIELSYDTVLVGEIARRCTEVESGARNVDNILTNTLLPEISRELLGRMAEGAKISSVHVSIGGDGKFVYTTAAAGPVEVAASAAA
ncbi:MAG TPA: type VI secretion system ATPase TssH [Terriglobales bacterium]|nr:type VI secretion system ATPase TssH [Terriglobales bacterium]